MSDDSLLKTLTLLRTQRVDAAAEVERLETELQDARVNLRQLDRGIEGLEPFVDEEIATQEDTGDETPEKSSNETPNETPNEVPNESPRENFTVPVPVRKKWPSTRMVAELVNDIGRPIHRDEILIQFDERFGTPGTWENPRNTIGNALIRAWERGTIERLDQNYFAPKGHDGALPREGRSG